MILMARRDHGPTLFDDETSTFRLSRVLDGNGLPCRSWNRRCSEGRRRARAGGQSRHAIVVDKQGVQARISVRECLSEVGTLAGPVGLG